MTECSCSNISEEAARKRRILAYSSFVVAFCLVVLNKLQPGPNWIRWSPAVPFFFGYLEVFQARARICIAMAFSDKAMFEGKVGPVESRAEGRKAKKRALRFLVTAAFLAFLSAALCAQI